MFEAFFDVFSSSDSSDFLDSSDDNIIQFDSFSDFDSENRRFPKI